MDYAAVSGTGLLPHSQGEWTRCHGCPISNEPNTACTGWWRWSSRSAWTVKCNAACFTEWPLHQRIWRHFFWMTSSTSRSNICWQSGPAGLLCLWVAVPSWLGTALHGVLYVLLGTDGKAKLLQSLTDCTPMLSGNYQNLWRTPERTLRWPPDVYISFSQPCCRFLQLLRFSASFNLFGPADTVGFTPSCLEAILMDLRVFCLVWLRPRFVSFRCVFLLAKRKSGREICGSLLLPVFSFCVDRVSPSLHVGQHAFGLLNSSLDAWQHPTSQWVSQSSIEPCAQLR